MKIVMMCLLAILSAEFTYAQSPTVGDHEMRERVGVIEQRLDQMNERFSGMDVKLSQMDQKIVIANKEKPDHWVCVGFCGSVDIDRYNNRQFSIESILQGEEKTPQLALRALLERSCSNEFYADSQGTVGVNVGNSCYKE